MKLYYFEGRGRAETVRLTLALAGAVWEDIYLKEREDFLALPSPYKQVPILALDDGTVLSQSGAIIRYLGRRYSLYADTIEEQFIADEVIEAASDCYPTVSRLPFQSEEERQRLIAELPKATSKWLTRWEQLPTDNTFLAGPRVTIGDAAALRCVLDLVESSNHSILENYPKLKSWLHEVTSIPSVKQYLGKRAPIVSGEAAMKYIADVERVLDRKIL